MGWNQPKNSEANTSDSPRNKTKTSLVRGLVAAVVIVLGGSLVAWLMLGGSDVSDKAEAKAKAESAGKPPKIATVARSSARTNRVSGSTATAPKKEIPKFEKRPGALQLPDGNVLTFPPPKEGETRKVYAYGHMYECDHLGNFKDISKRKLFHTAFEANFFALAQADKPFIPAFLTGLDEADVRKMLEKEYKPLGDETDEEIEQLKAYDSMRGAILDYMDQGGKFDDFVNDLAGFQRKERESRAMGLREIMQLVKQGKVAEAKEMAQAADKLMEKNGYKPIRLPQHVKDAFDAMPDATVRENE